ncbi:unnamed protein product [Clonostachys rosea f. rosea IK726]|uniref:Xylose isomerase-like TIM barrel domain-containing protein n=2 Tax=Bionectria ochroleuca TaxID=29856 RepID=A0A0B7KL07_BIOOC|nr:unnamed protein product [Clonostachys rosea f. rosea IK726]
MCKERNLEIICVQFLRYYEGLSDRNEHEKRFQELQVWIQVARALGTDMIMMPASALPADQVGNRDLIIKDLQKPADAAQTEIPYIRFAFEARCSATRVDKWEYSWDVIKAVDRPNLDPAAPSSRVPDGDAAIDLSLRRLVKLVKPEREKVFLVQIGDARLPDEPVGSGSFEYSPKSIPRMVWSQKYRLFYGERNRGGFLPVEKIVDTILDGVEYEGWVSLELFSDRTDDLTLQVLTELARRGAVSWKKLAEDMGWWLEHPKRT